MLCCGDRTCQKSCDENLQTASKQLSEHCVWHYECTENYLCCPNAASPNTKICSVSDAGKCLEINLEKTFEGGEALKIESYHEYIERLRREEHLKHPNLVIEHKEGEPITA